jgi:hypothetical protein
MMRSRVEQMGSIQSRVVRPGVRSLGLRRVWMLALSLASGAAFAERCARQSRIHWTRLRGAWLLALFLASAAAFAQSPPDGLRACAGLNSDHARLKCYDDGMAALGVARATGHAGPAAETVLGGAASVSSGASASAQSSAATHATLPPAPPATQAAAASVAPDDFGLDASALRKKRGEPDPVSSPETQLVARVKSVGHRATGELSIELDNGQIWAETRKRAGSSVSVGDTVTIRPGKLGSYFLSTHSGFALRVARLQ